MPDWTSSMRQTFEYCIVDPGTWGDVELIADVKSCTINRDSDAETLGSATIDVTESVGEKYVRVYLITIQNGVREKHPLGTFLVQSPSSSFTGSVQDVSMDAYTPLLELKENNPPIGYSLLKNTNTMLQAYRVVREHVRAPVVQNSSDNRLFTDFVAEPDDSWLTFTRDLIANAKFHFELDEMGRILFAPEQEVASLQPVWTYDDSNSSILNPTLNLEQDLYGIPNVVEVIYSNGNDHYYAKAVNDDKNSPISTIARGREITYRVTDLNLIGDPTQRQINEYATKLLKDLSSLEYTITYTHGYCPVRLGDCVRMNYERAGLVGIKAKVISQSIECTPGCPVTEKAVFTTRLWG